MGAAFEKYEGLGNDFVVVAEGAVDETAARALCDRHFGVGADGVLLVGPSTLPSARARMSIINADGSRPEMCGNGLRCVALHLAEQDHAEQADYVVETDSGALPCAVRRSGRSATVRIGLGRAVEAGTMETSFEGQSYRFQRFSMGNPHAILFDADLDVDAIDRLGPRVCSEVPGGTNVEFVRTAKGNGFDLVVWERGVGRTLACGTGAAATAAALCLAGRTAFDEPVVIRLPGGPLRLTVARRDLSVQMEGPARHVFSGRWSQ